MRCPRAVLGVRVGVAKSPCLVGFSGVTLGIGLFELPGRRTPMLRHVFQIEGDIRPEEDISGHRVRLMI